MAGMTVAEFLGELTQGLPLTKAAGWDPVGLQIGDRAAEVTRVAVCHEVTAPVVDRIVDDGAIDLVVAYHPLLFRPTTRLVAGSGPAGRALRLAAAGVALVVVHTAFDVAPGGAADALAASLGLVDVSGFGPLWGPESTKIVTFVPSDAADRVAEAMAAAGAGRIGNYSGCSYRLAGTGTFVPEATAEPAVGERLVRNDVPEVRVEMVCPEALLAGVVASLIAAHPYEEPAFDVFPHRGNAGLVGRVGRLGGVQPLEVLASTVAEALGGVLRVAGTGADSIERVAVVPGSGSDLLEQAAGLADVLVTGDVGHHRARRAAELGISVIDPGHGPTERPGLARLYAAVSEIGVDHVDLTAVDSSPWKE